jgi:hypothetical protein
MDERENKKEDYDKGQEKHEHPPKPEPPGRIIHPRPSHGHAWTR